MSSGTFTRTRYELDNGDITNIRVQPETLALVIDGNTNAGVTDAVTRAGSAKVSGGRRSLGVNARLVRIRFTAAKADYAEGDVIALPWLQKATFDNLELYSTGTYLGTAIELVGKTAESVR